ncbi:sulfotransferase family 2 domain-containing protein [Nodosilinea sp. P-1105]|uniref:sulfotransferase family 2 domain-containing protein n=1 Tax=Nodosilinea sp. P-1105 TaxID=2546229 RepID=UPI00146CAC27|nr:sulfotransferase family 2 domain-containing protein [Nodosilinea sp. P-1105]NMF85925.1 hypothetical protein [Nodosilinea sp. P-1105]
MISLQKKFLFIHVPKTGGNSIQSILKDYSEDKIIILEKHQDGVERFEVRSDRYKVHKHSTLTEYKNMIEDSVYNSLFKFSVIRNPWDMMISWYFSPHRKIKDWVRDDFQKLIDEVQPLSYYIKDSLLLENQRSWLSRLNFSQRKIQKGSLIRDIDFLIRFEYLNEDFKEVCKKIYIPFVELPLRNKSSRGHYSRYYDEDLKEKVRSKFSEEIKFGNYEFEQD